MLWLCKLCPTTDTPPGPPIPPLHAQKHPTCPTIAPHREGGGVRVRAKVRGRVHERGARMQDGGRAWEGGQWCEMEGEGIRGKVRVRAWGGWWGCEGEGVWGRFKVVDLNLCSLPYFIINISLFSCYMMAMGEPVWNYKSSKNLCRSHTIYSKIYEISSILYLKNTIQCFL